MIELLAGTTAILAVLLIAAIVYAITYRRERDYIRNERDDIRDLHEANHKFQAGTIEILGNRVENLRNDNRALEQQVDTLRTGHDKLVDERDQLKRHLGRMEAEARAAKPKRGPGGKFIAKSKSATVTPIKCG